MTAHAARRGPDGSDPERVLVSGAPAPALAVGAGGIDQVLELARQHLDMDVALLSEFTGGQQVYHRTAGDSEDFGCDVGTGTPLPQTYCQAMVLGQIPNAIPDATQHPLTSRLPATAAAGIGSYVGVPIRLADGGLYGSLCVLSHRPRPVDERDAKFLAMLAELVAQKVEADLALARARERLDALVVDLRRAIVKSELVVYYQPKIDLEQGRCGAVEALVRWQHPDRGLVFPDEFIPLAESSGLIVELTNWVVQEALRQNRIWQDDGLYLSVAINISAASLTDPSLVSTFRGALDEFGISPFTVEIELTETAVMENPALAQQVLGQFDALGIHAAIDDFGTGFSSLVYLRDMPVHTLKIDKSFVIPMGVNDRNSAIVASTIALGHALGLGVVAEGVEDAASAAALSEAGCELGQGYYWSRPLPADALFAWVTEFNAAAVPRPRVGSGRTTDQYAVAAVQSLFAARRPSELRDALVLFVTRAGGVVVSAEDAYGSDVMQVDLTLGVGDALLPVAVPGTLARRHLDELLPMLLACGRLVLAQQGAK